MTNAPPIQFVRAPDGARIAFYQVGDGPAMLHVPAFAMAGLAPGLQFPWMREFHEQISRRFRYIKMDPRGTGMSEPDPDDFALDTLAHDMAAVLDAADAPTTAIVSDFHSAPAAIRFAATYPDRVTQLVLLWPYQRGEDVYEGTRTGALRELMPVDYKLWVETIARSLGFRSEEDVEGFAELFSSVGPEDIRSLNERARLIDVQADLPRIRAKTLVVSADAGPAPPAVSVDVAAAIPSAQLFSIPSVAALAQEWPSILQFLGVDNAASTTPQAAFRTILFTDVVASTPLLAQLKDARMRAVMRDHDAVLQAAVDEHGGRVVKEIGDAFMAEFAVPSAAVECAIAMQRGIRSQFADTDVPIRLRIGINAGEPVEEDGDLHGASVVIAKRLESAASENGILVSEVVKQAVAGKEFEFVPQGDFELKGFDEPVRAWSVEWA